jgi:hypothetical protein
MILVRLESGHQEIWNQPYLRAVNRLRSRLTRLLHDLHTFLTFRLVDACSGNLLQ